MTYPINWDLDKFFPDHKTLSHFIDALENEIETFSKTVSKREKIEEAIELAQHINARLHHASSFTGCLLAQNTDDTQAMIFEDKLSMLGSDYSTQNAILDEHLKNLDDDSFEKLISKPPFNAIAFPLKERRIRAKDKLPFEKEKLINSLSVSGYHGWSSMFDKLIGEVKAEFEGEELSFGQIENKFSSKDRAYRKRAFESLVKPFSMQRNLFAQTLNHIGGYRLALYKERRWTSILKEPLEENKLSLDTLNCMWQCVSVQKAPLKEYMDAKAKMLGIQKLSWYDLNAPLGEVSLDFTYEEGCAFIIRHFKAFSPKMADFAENAIKNGWIEAEDRAGKAPGGFCCELPLMNETRIFLTYSDTFNNLSTIAHELGHAFHSHQCFPLPEMAQHYSMSVAETASTMAEMIVIDAAIKEAKTPDEKLALLDDKINRAMAFLMNIHARFLFEMSFYKERQEGFVPPERLCELMEAAQKAAYLDNLEEYHPYFWAAKMHFYFTGLAFYNFPYTFGYLFSLGIYATLKKDPKNAENRYIDLLKDTGLMDTETLAKKHLDVDLTKPDFWNLALGEIHKDIEQFLEIVRTK